jgi:hypothetical protein
VPLPASEGRLVKNDGLKWPHCDVLNLPHLRPIAPTRDDRFVAHMEDRLSRGRG